MPLLQVVSSSSISGQIAVGLSHEMKAAMWLHALPFPAMHVHKTEITSPDFLTKCTTYTFFAFKDEEQ